MSETSIEQKNVIIARFMGIKATDDFIKQNYPYHSDWSWLMLVWFKIQTIGADLGYSFKKFHEKFHAGIDHQKIEMCHEAVYQFIQWYNQKQKEQQP